MPLTLRCQFTAGITASQRSEDVRGDGSMPCAGGPMMAVLGHSALSGRWVMSSTTYIFPVLFLVRP